MFRFKDELLYLGMLTALLFAYMTGEIEKGLKAGSFYLFIQYIPYIPWVSELEETLLTKYLIISISGFFLNPLIYYYLNVFGVPISLPSLIIIAIIIFVLGTYRNS